MPRRTLPEWYEDTLNHWHAWRTWHRARTYNDLLAINTNRLAGLLDNLSPLLSDDKGREMLTTQIELNRAGFFTLTAQPGGVDEGLYGSPIQHRAAIHVIIPDNGDWDRLEDWLYNHDHVAINRDEKGAGGIDFTVLELHNPDHTTGQRDVGPIAIRGVPVTRAGTPENGLAPCRLPRPAGPPPPNSTTPTRPSLTPWPRSTAAGRSPIYDTAWGESTLFTVLAEAAKARQIRLGLLDAETGYESAKAGTDS